jgi:hypothetical protein
MVFLYSNCVFRYFIARADGNTEEIPIDKSDINNPLMGSYIPVDTEEEIPADQLALSDKPHDRNSGVERNSRDNNDRESRDSRGSRDSFDRPRIKTMLSTKLEQPLRLSASQTAKLELGTPTKDSPDDFSWNHIYQVFQQIKTPALSVTFVFLVTIGLFPCLTVFLESKSKCNDVNNRFQNDMFVPFFFVMFNLFDFIGRVAAGALRPLFTASNVWIGAAARIVFFPLFLLCRVSNSQLPVVFGDDAFPIVFMMLFALSNGYVASSCMMLGSSGVSARESSLAGTIMIFSLTFGLLCGATFSFLTVYISQGAVN